MRETHEGAPVIGERSLKLRLSLALGSTLLAACGAANASPEYTQPVGVDAAVDVTLSKAVGAPEVELPIKAPTIKNFLAIVLDDMHDFSCEDTKKYLPKSSKWIKDRGICYENTSTPDPVCCPARSALMTGQYPHNNRVRRQIDAEKLNSKNTLQSELGREGFLTHGGSKFLNGIDSADIETGKVDSGFKRNDFWNSYLYRGYQLLNNKGEWYKPKKDIHTTVRTGMNMRKFLRFAAKKDKRFYEYSAFYAPHGEVGHSSDPSTDKKWPKPTKAHVDTPVPKANYVMEQGRRDKLPLFRKANHAPRYAENINKARLRALRDVDNQIAKAFRLLKRKDILDDTAVAVLSDNGWFATNWWVGKSVPYDRAIDVPLYLYVPGISEGGTIDNRNVSLVDVSATAYDLLNIKPKHRLDGRSLLSKFTRNVMLYSYGAEDSKRAKAESGAEVAYVPTWAALETKNGVKYIEYRDGNGKTFRREFYAASDPNQLRNLMYRGYADERPGAKRLKRLANRLHRLEHCKGTNENAPNPCP